MPKGDIVEKRILLIEGEELPGLVAVDAVNNESDIVEVPGRDKVVSVTNGVEKIPTFLLTYKIGRETETATFLNNWYKNREEKQCVLQRTDGSGNILEQRDLGYCQLSSFNIPAYAAEAPVFAQVSCLLVPESYDRIV